ncbi:hypothetical protein KR018_007333, partial [Drosophila ironensis]
DGTPETVERHWRGCACALKPCIRLCCHHSHVLFEDSECRPAGEELMDHINPYLNVTREDGTVASFHFRKDLVVQWDLPKPCSLYYRLDDQKSDEQYAIIEVRPTYVQSYPDLIKSFVHQNGTLFHSSSGSLLNKWEYCLQPHAGSERVVSYHCLKEQERDIGKTGGKKVHFPCHRLLPGNLSFAVITLSLICMAISIAVYLYVPRLRNFQGKCFVCYMCGLFFGYLFILLDIWELSLGFCKTAGFLGYFAIMAAFLWLSVISLHLWNMLKGGNPMLRSEDHFPVYSLYAWGIAACLTAVIFAVDTVFYDEEETNIEWLPKVGFYSCWIYGDGYSAMIYFYGPILFLIVFNTTMFILTAIRIVGIKRDLKNFTVHQDRKQKLNSDNQTYIFFLRLFIIMGVSWTLEIISFLLNDYPLWENVLLIADYINMAQGIIIFVLFIMKRSTLELLVKR